MSEIERTHWTGCWIEHHECAVQRVREVERQLAEQAEALRLADIENAQLQHGTKEPDWMRRLRSSGMLCGEDTQTGAFTHTVTLKLHGPGPTHSHHNDDPPTR